MECSLAQEHLVFLRLRLLCSNGHGSGRSLCIMGKGQSRQSQWASVRSLARSWGQLARPQSTVSTENLELVWETQLLKRCSVNFDLGRRVGLAHRPGDKGSPLQFKGSSLEAASLQARELWAEGL